MNFEKSKKISIITLVIFFMCFTVFLLGIYSNSTVSVLNNGKMPVYASVYNGHEIPEENTNTHFLFYNRNEIKAYFLADIHESGLYKNGDYIFSIGDVLLYLGGYSSILFVFIFIIFSIITIIKYVNLNKK